MEMGNEPDGYASGSVIDEPSTADTFRVASRRRLSGVPLVSTACLPFSAAVYGDAGLSESKTLHTDGSRAHTVCVGAVGTPITALCTRKPTIRVRAPDRRSLAIDNSVATNRVFHLS